MLKGKLKHNHTESMICLSISVLLNDKHMPVRGGAKPGTQPEPPCARPCLPMKEALNIP